MYNRRPGLNTVTATATDELYRHFSNIQNRTAVLRASMNTSTNTNTITV